MRRNNNSMSKIIIIIIIVIILLVIVLRCFVGKGNNKDYINYVSTFEKAIVDYSSENMEDGSMIYTYDSLKDILLSAGLINEYKDSKVIITGNDIIISKSGSDISFYNYNNEKTYENRFELNFDLNGKTVTCTKNECN